MALTLWATRNGVAVGSGPIFSALSAEIVMTELSQFSHSTITLPGADARAIAAMAPYTLLEIQQDGLGTIGYGFVSNPRQTVDEQDQHVITIDIEPLSLECTWDRTLAEWEADTWLSIIFTRLAGLVIPQGGAPQWQFTFLGPPDSIVSVNLNNPTPLGGALDIAKQFQHFARIGVDAVGAPTRVLEVGQFGAAPTMWLTSANGGDAEAMSANPLIRVAATIEREPNNVIDLVNVVAPYGGGQDIGSLVTLERLWRMVNDPNYVNYGRYGTDAESIARTGKASVFPEYDGVNYPLSDPRNPPSGQWQMIYPPTGEIATVPSTGEVARYQASGWVLYQGNLGTRRFTTTGRPVYFVYDAASYATYGYKSREFIDSSITYGSDTSVANQETIARALYIEAITNFKRFGHPHHTFSCTIENDIGRPTRAGDLIAVDVQRVSVGDDGAVQELNVVENLRVMKWTRTFNGDAPPVGTLVLSNLGRFDQDDTTAFQEQAKAIVALQRNQGTGLASSYLPWAENIDAANPIIIPFYIVREHFRYHNVRVQVDFYPFRGTATTATNIAGTPVISADVEVQLPTPSDVAISGGNHNGTGFVSDSALIGGMPAHIHTTGATAGGSGAPTSSSQWLEAFEVDGTYAQLSRHNGGFRLLKTSPQILGIDLNPTAHTTVTPMQKVIKAAASIIAHIPAGQRIANLPAHVHDVEKRIPTGTPSPASITMTVDGLALSSGIAATGTRDTSGAFTSAFVVSNIGDMLDAHAADSVVPLMFSAGTSGSNPFGTGYLRILISIVEELGGLVSTFSG